MLCWLLLMEGCLDPFALLVGAQTPAHPPSTIPIRNLLGVEDPGSLDCAWIGPTKELRCLAWLPRAQLSALSTRERHPLLPGGAPSGLEGGCAGLGFGPEPILHAAEPIQIGRAVVLPWVVLYTRPDDKEICVESQYRYRRSDH